MFKTLQNAFKKLIGKQEQKQERKDFTRKAELNIYGQPHVLQAHMKVNRLTHDEKVIVDFRRIRLERYIDHAFIYFCPMQRIDIIEQLQPGDGKDIPETVTMDLNVSECLRTGLYNLKNVELHSNGKITLKETADTVWEYIPPQESPVTREWFEA